MRANRVRPQHLGLIVFSIPQSRQLYWSATVTDILRTPLPSTPTPTYTTPTPALSQISCRRVEFRAELLRRPLLGGPSRIFINSCSFGIPLQSNCCNEFRSRISGRRNGGSDGGNSGGDRSGGSDGRLRRWSGGAQHRRLGRG